MKMKTIKEALEKHVFETVGLAGLLEEPCSSAGRCQRIPTAAWITRAQVPGVEMAPTNPSGAASHAERAGLCLHTPVNYPIWVSWVFWYSHCLEICCWENINNLTAHSSLLCLGGLPVPWGRGCLVCLPHSQTHCQHSIRCGYMVSCWLRAQR